jgi:hypothetical protein
VSDMTKDAATALRKPFPAASIGKLPKGGAMLDYVGHAAVTDRLLTVDPNWSWEPFSVGPDGLPALDRSNNLWIRLTICGVTRIGVGDGKSAKECIGDAIRNAAMRFGVALDLWAKEDLVEFAQAANRPTEAAPERPATEERPPGGVSGPQIKMLGALMTKAGLKDRDDALKYVSDIVGRPVESRNELTSREAHLVIEELKKDTEATS